MGSHNVTNEQLVQYVLGDAPSEKAREIETHLRQCEPCRQAVGRLRTLLDCADRMSAVPDEKHSVQSANREVLLAAKTQDKDQPRRRLESSAAAFRRIIMNSKWSKLAVAAVIVLAVILGLSLFTGDGTSKVYARVIDQLHNAKTLTYSIVTMTGQKDMPTVRQNIAFKVVDGTSYGRIATADGYISIVHIKDGGAIEGVSLVPATKTFIEIRIDNPSDDPSASPWPAIEKLQALPERADKAVGRKEFDGRTLEGYLVHEQDATTTVWIDPRTGELGRVELAYADAPGMDVIMSDFQFDIPLEDSLFSMEPPEGYTPVQAEADASQVTEQDFIEFLRLWSNWTKDATFPPIVAGPEIAKITVQMSREGKFVGPYAPAYGAERQGQVMYRGLVFATQLPYGTWRYAGQNVRFGDPAVPIFWYRPQGSATWHVIYADLHVADVTPENLPK